MHYGFCIISYKKILFIFKKNVYLQASIEFFDNGCIVNNIYFSHFDKHIYVLE